MLRYQPPKSNVWGHSLRKMLPSVQRERSAAFHDRTIERIGRRTASFSISPLSHRDPKPSDAIAELEALFGRQCVSGRFNLSDREYEMAMDALIKKERQFPDLAYELSLWAMVEIQAWRIHDRISDTASSIHWVFGTSPRISTTFWFQSRDEFYHVQEALEELRICHLNEKHLKEMKRRV